MGSSATKMYTDFCKRIRLKLFTFCQLMLALYIKELMKSRTKPTPVFLPGEPQGQGSLVGCRLWGCTESDTTEAT